ncbi:MAG: hypothetical protein VR70_05745 [Rhodospirillaceae bacterium BRH_c57]|nr:MAG: hypothetical protein VR70_05745 [Rhodospirillaceae bacterium BRH_c57]
MLFTKSDHPPHHKLYTRMRNTDQEAMRAGAETGRGTYYRIFNRGCGGGSSFLIREESLPDNACSAWVVFATHADDGIESSSFPTHEEAAAFVQAAVNALCKK